MSNSEALLWILISSPIWFIPIIGVLMGIASVIQAIRGKR